MSLAVPAVPTPYIHVAVKRRKTTWYSVTDGNWSDPLTWESNASRRWAYPGQNIPSPVFPQVGDDVYIGHRVTLNTGSSSSPMVVNNLYVSGSLLFDSTFRSLIVNGDIQATGSVNMSNAAHILTLYGVNNFINSFTCGTTATVIYARTGDQPVMDLTYRNLTLQNLGSKTISNNLVVNGNLLVTIDAILPLALYDATIIGVTTISVRGSITKSGSGSVLFTGLLTVGGTLDFSTGNPTVELRGGINASVPPLFSTGTGVWTFTTNNQTITGFLAQLTFDAPLIISGAITVTILAGTLFQVQFNSPIDGNNASSKLLMGAGSTLYLNMTTPPMSGTGIFDFTTNANTIGYIMAASYTLPYTTYSSLIIRGAGVKTLSGTTLLNGSLTVNSGSTLDLSTYDLTVTTTTALIGISTLTKGSSGSILFIGQVNFGSATIDLTGNPSVELRGGLILGGGNAFNGTVTLQFSTNNQNITLGAGGTVLPYNILISGAITLTNNTSGIGTNFVISGTINGDNASSTFDNRQSVTAFHYTNATQPMITGILECNAAANRFNYDGNLSQAVKGGTYRTLEFGGSGIKTLQGNVIVNTTAGGSWSISGTATINYNGFTISTI